MSSENTGTQIGLFAKGLFLADSEFLESEYEKQ